MIVAQRCCFCFGVSQIADAETSRGAWRTAVKQTAVDVTERNIATIYNNTIGLIPGVAKIDMEQVRAAIGLVADEAKKDLRACP